MADVHNKKTRSYNMSMIRNKDTKPEIIVRKFLFGNGFRYKLHDKMLPGKPDLVFPKHKTIIFIHGCFWHGHTNCKYFVVPKTRTEWWLNKIKTNKKNDKKSCRAITQKGWSVITIWECQLRKHNLENTLLKLIKSIHS